VLGKAYPVPSELAGARVIAAWAEVVPERVQEAARPVRFARGEVESVPLPATSPLDAECAAFLRSVRDRSRPLADGRSGVAVVRALAAGQRSLRAHGAPARLESNS